LGKWRDPLKGTFVKDVMGFPNYLDISVNTLFHFYYFATFCNGFESAGNSAFSIPKIDTVYVWNK
jgi:hypothetical protein